MKANWRIIVEGVAVISVVLSLVFVGYELRVSSSIARAEAFNSFIITLSEHNRTLATEGNLAPLLARIGTGTTLSEFDEIEEVQIRSIYASLLHIWNGLYRSIEEGILDREDFELIGQGEAFDSNFFREIWFGGMRNNHPDNFVEMFESMSWNQL